MYIDINSKASIKKQFRHFSYRISGKIILSTLRFCGPMAHGATLMPVDKLVFCLELCPFVNHQYLQQVLLTLPYVAP